MVMAEGEGGNPLLPHILACMRVGGAQWSPTIAPLHCSCQVVAPDLRGHGLTTAGDEGDLSAATLAGDVVALWGALFGGSAADPPPEMVMVGHSMSGAIAVHAAALQGESTHSLPKEAPLGSPLSTRTTEPNHPSLASHPKP
jgi:pimeloyl-ACP methyl ester carboxylesterase